MSNGPTQLVQKRWNYCNILRDDGLFLRLHPIPTRQDGDYVEQLTFPLFLKMADEQSRPPPRKRSAVPCGHGPEPAPCGSLCEPRQVRHHEEWHAC